MTVKYANVRVNLQFTLYICMSWLRLSTTKLRELLTVLWISTKIFPCLNANANFCYYFKWNVRISIGKWIICFVWSRNDILYCSWHNSLRCNKVFKTCCFQRHSYSVVELTALNFNYRKRIVLHINNPTVRWGLFTIVYCVEVAWLLQKYKYIQ